jgi:hypothetical protein
MNRQFSRTSRERTGRCREGYLTGFFIFENCRYIFTFVESQLHIIWTFENHPENRQFSGSIFDNCPTLIQTPFFSFFVDQVKLFMKDKGPASKISQGKVPTGGTSQVLTPRVRDPCAGPYRLNPLKPLTWVHYLARTHTHTQTNKIKILKMKKQETPSSD